MKLSELFFGNKQVNDTGSVQTSSVQGNVNFGRQLQALSPGQTIQGEVISRNGNEVQIKIADTDTVLKAKVDQNIHLELGKTITFEVKNNGQTLTLSPLYTNTATDANVLKALNMASLPLTSDTIYMTEQMMQAGLSIDKNSLLQMYKEVNMFQGSQIADIVDLHRMSMSVNEENLAQISSYKNMTHQLVNGLQEVTNALPDTVSQMVQSGDVEGAAKLYQDLLNLISGQGENPGEQAVAEQTGKALDAGAAQGTIVIQDGDLQQGNLTAANGQAGNAQEANAQAANMQAANGGTVNPQMSGDLQLLLDMLAARNETARTEGTLQAPAGDANMAAQEAQQVLNTTGENALGTQREINALLGRLLQQGIDAKDTALLQNLLGNKEVAAYIKENLQSMWTIRPEDVAEGARVNELYERLGKQLRGLAQTLENVNQTGSEAYRATTNLTRNLDFLQQLNQTYTYLQLPLRLQQGNNAHGDLYVYTNKKHLAAKEGQITALLHLDMENLGPLDVYVALYGEKVSTKFYVQDEVLDFLAGHMDLLTERLRKRGYQCSCEMITREKEDGADESVIHKLLEKEPQIPLVQYAFDVRT